APAPSGEASLHARRALLHGARFAGSLASRSGFARRRYLTGPRPADASPDLAAGRSSESVSDVRESRPACEGAPADVVGGGDESRPTVATVARCTIRGRLAAWDAVEIVHG